VLRVKLGDAGQPLRRMLCLGAHCDDIEIGCGGTILKLLTLYPRMEICWVVFSSDGVREREACKCAALFLQGTRQPRVIVRDFRNGFFPFVGAEIKEFFEELKSEFQPDLIFTHYRDDRHQDHRTLSDLTWNTFRNHMILEYEIPKYDGDLGSPNFFVSLEPAICKRKIRYIRSAFSSQRDKHWFTEDAFQALLRIRGIECGSPSKFAEAFYCRKMALQSV
jgi:LmbE family N-acetylglucosaminyl deacetylase